MDTRSKGGFRGIAQGAGNDRLRRSVPAAVKLGSENPSRIYVSADVSGEVESAFRQLTRETRMPPPAPTRTTAQAGILQAVRSTKQVSASTNGPVPVIAVVKTGS